MAINPIITLYTSDPSHPSSAPTAYILTEHNRQPLQIGYERIEESTRMADGTMRRFIAANKKKISLSWQNIPAAGGYNFTADGNLGAAFMKSFYEENVFNVIWIKLTYAQESWRFTNPAGASIRYPVSQAFSTPNTTYKTTQTNTTLAPSTFKVASVTFSAISNGAGTASIVTTVPHNFRSTTFTPEFFLSGINQLFNGTWQTDSVPAVAASNVITFKFGDTFPNPQLDFRLNSYYQTGSTGYFNVDQNNFLTTGASLSIQNTNYTSGSSINGTWVVTGTSGQTQFTASVTSASQVQSNARGDSGDVFMLSSSSVTLKTSQVTSFITGPTVSSDIVKCLITNFDYQIEKRYAGTDYVNVSMEFTEV